MTTLFQYDDYNWSSGWSHIISGSKGHSILSSQLLTAGEPSTVLGSIQPQFRWTITYTGIVPNNVFSFDALFKIKIEETVNVDGGGGVNPDQGTMTMSQELVGSGTYYEAYNIPYMFNGNPVYGVQWQDAVLSTITPPYDLEHISVTLNRVSANTYVGHLSMAPALQGSSIVSGTGLYGAQWTSYISTTYEVEKE